MNWGTQKTEESIIPNLSDSVGSGVLGKCQSFVAPIGQQLPPDPEVREVFFRNPPLLSLVIPVTISGVQAKAVVDSAAQVTVISLKSLSEMKHPPALGEQVSIKYAGESACITAYHIP